MESDIGFPKTIVLPSYSSGDTRPLVWNSDTVNVVVDEVTRVEVEVESTFDLKPPIFPSLSHGVTKQWKGCTLFSQRCIYFLLHQTKCFCLLGGRRTNRWLPEWQWSGSHGDRTGSWQFHVTQEPDPHFCYPTSTPLPQFIFPDWEWSERSRKDEEFYQPTKRVNHFNKDVNRMSFSFCPFCLFRIFLRGPDRRYYWVW